MEKVDSFIAERRQEGELDSEGLFTVDALGALRKTLASALPEPHYYLFQLAQGLLAGGARNIEIAIGRNATRFHFIDPQGAFTDLQEAQARLGRGLTLSSSRPLDLLMTGMATAVGSEMDRADLRVAYSSQALSLTLDSANLVERPSGQSDPVCCLELHRSVSKGLSFAWTRIWGARGEESELQRRFEFATPPLKIAGLATAPGSAWLREVPAVPGVERLILVEATVLDLENPGHRGPDLSMVGSGAKGSLRCLCRQAFTPEGERLSVPPDADEWQQRRWSFYGTGSSIVESSVWWIRNGMTVERTFSNLGLPGLLVLAPADDLDIDASGYSLVRNDKFLDRVAQAGELARQTLGSFSRSDVEKMLWSSDLPGAMPLGEEQVFIKSLIAEYPWLSS